MVKNIRQLVLLFPDDKEPLNKDKKIAQEWIDDELTWSDVYSKKSEEYLEIIATGGVPRWDNDNKKYVSSSEPVFTKQDSTSEVGIDPQDEEDPTDDLPILNNYVGYFGTQFNLLIC